MESHEYANLFPMLPEAELSTLAMDIKINGQVEPIITYRGKILDGRNRYAACGMIDMPPWLSEFSGPDPLAYVLSHNLHRRHLSESQRAMIAARLATMKQGAPVGNQNNRVEEKSNPPIGGFDLEISQMSAAKMLNVGIKSVERANKVNNFAVPEIKKMVEKGDLSVSAAANLAELPIETQQAATAAGLLAVKAAAKEVAAKKQETPPRPPPPPQPPGPLPKYIPKDGLMIAAAAMCNLDKILPTDLQREAALREVIAYCNDRLNNRR
jgi:hypothetical protein